MSKSTSISTSIARGEIHELPDSAQRGFHRAFEEEIATHPKKAVKRGVSLVDANAVQINFASYAELNTCANFVARNLRDTILRDNDSELKSSRRGDRNGPHH